MFVESNSSVIAHCPARQVADLVHSQSETARFVRQGHFFGKEGLEAQQESQVRLSLTSCPFYS